MAARARRVRFIASVEAAGEGVVVVPPAEAVNVLREAGRKCGLRAVVVLPEVVAVRR
jgi:hypothetical protein